MRVGSEASVEARTAARRHRSEGPMSTSSSVKPSASSCQTLRSFPASASVGLVYVTVKGSLHGNAHTLRPSFASLPRTATLVTVRG